MNNNFLLCKTKLYFKANFFGTKLFFFRETFQTFIFLLLVCVPVIFIFPKMKLLPLCLVIQNSLFFVSFFQKIFLRSNFRALLTFLMLSFFKFSLNFQISWLATWFWSIVFESFLKVSENPANFKTALAYSSCTTRSSFYGFRYLHLRKCLLHNFSVFLLSHESW